MKKLGIISFNAPHLKTEQIILNLHSRYAITVYALPFVPRPARTVMFQHRPDQSEAAHPREICGQFNIPFIPIMHDWEIENGLDYYLIAGAGILSERCLQGKQILNAHPGVIPAVRGLDAFKWSIYELKPLGVTLHYIDKNIDVGQIVSIVPTPILPSDKLGTLARRHYENEISLLSNFEEYVSAPYSNPYAGIPAGESTRRMKLHQEEVLEKRFELYKQRYCSHATQ